MKVLISLCADGISIDKVEKRGKKLIYNGLEFPGFDKPIVLKTGKKKRAVLAKKGNKFKLIKYGLKGASDFTIHKDEERRQRFRSRFRGIMTKEGKPAYKDKWQAAYWAYNDLW